MRQWCILHFLLSTFNRQQEFTFPDFCFDLRVTTWQTWEVFIWIHTPLYSFFLSPLIWVKFSRILEDGWCEPPGFDCKCNLAIARSRIILKKCWRFFHIFHSFSVLRFFQSNGLFKKSVSWPICSFIFWSLSLFYLSLIFKMPDACSIRSQFWYIFKSLKFFALKISIKYSKHGQNFSASKNT